MAEIPVERKKGGLPWWLPLLLLLLLIPLLFFLLRGCNNAPATNTNTNGNANRATGMTNGNANTVAVVTNSNSGMTNSNSMTASNNSNANSTAGGMVSDVNLFGSTADKASLVGRSVDLHSVKVNRVLSDKVFTVTSGSGEMFALLGDSLNAGAKEQQIKIKAGQVLNLAGDFRTVPTGETQKETDKGSLSLNQKEYAQMKGQQIYLHTTKVEDAK